MFLSSRILWLLCIACVGLLPACRKPVPPAGEFDATLHLGASDLWVSGHSIHARQVPVSCRRGRLTFQDLVSHREIHLSSRASELNQLMDRYWARYSTRGWESALDLLRASPLVEEVRVSETGTLVVFKKGKAVLPWFFPPGDTTRTEPNPYAGMSEAEIVEAMSDRRIANWNAGYFKLIQDIQKHIDGLSVGMLVVLDNAGHVKYFANQARTLAEAQLLHVAHGGSLETLPEGPFTPKDVVLREVASAGRSR